MLNKDKALSIIKLLRPKQWVKNAFVLAPLIFSSNFHTPYKIGLSLCAFIIFSIAASAVYILNDLKDIEKDRNHPIKSKKRPLASGAVSKKEGIILLLCMYGLLILSLCIFPKLTLVVGGYTLLNIAYTFYLKEQPVLDIFTIAFGFVMRVYAGAIAINVVLSSWMFITTLCLALFLASIKRKQELQKSGSASRDILSKYTVQLVSRYAEMSAIGALIFYSLFVLTVTSQPNLVITIPLVLFGLFRYWYLVEALDGGESPTDALLSDPPLMFTIALWAISCLYIFWN